MEMSPEKKARTKQGAILGLIAGVILFGFFYMVAGQLMYLIFIPLACAMGAAVQFVKDDAPEDDE